MALEKKTNRMIRFTRRFCFQKQNFDVFKKKQNKMTNWQKKNNTFKQTKDET